VDEMVVKEGRGEEGRDGKGEEGEERRKSRGW
jgi:hypothetical protein